MDNVIFFVCDEPYCLWEHDLADQVQTFLRSFDAEYFDYLLRIHVEAEDEKRAAMSLRVAYHHALETLMSFLGAMAQAPTAPHAWIARCSNARLREVVERISQDDQSLRTGLKPKPATWANLAKVTFSHYQPGTARQQETIALFADLWRRLAGEFLDRYRIDEYNSLKHGFRVSAGDFGLQIGIEHEYGVPPPEDEMQMLANSEFGTSYRRIVLASKQPGERSLVAEQVSINWKIGKIARLIQLVSLSLENVLSSLQILNGKASQAMRFRRPVDDSAFAAPWRHEQEINNFTLRMRADAEVPHLRKETILDSVDGMESTKPNS